MNQFALMKAPFHYWVYAVVIKHWPEQERPREKLLSQGAEHLSDAELLAIFLRTGIRGKTAIDLARDMLSHFGTLRGLLNAEHNEFCQLKGLGTAKYVQLQAVLEMSSRVLEESLKQTESFNSPQQTKRFLQHKLREQPREVFACLFLDNQNKVIEFECLFWGTINAAAIYPREVVRRSLELGAAAIIFAHNHPSGITEPSLADKEITQRLIHALSYVDIRVLDHMIVGEGEVLSFAERGLL